MKGVNGTRGNRWGHKVWCTCIFFTRCFVYYNGFAVLYVGVLATACLQPPVSLLFFRNSLVCKSRVLKPVFFYFCSALFLTFCLFQRSSECSFRRQSLSVIITLLLLLYYIYFATIITCWLHPWLFCSVRHNIPLVCLNCRFLKSRLLFHSMLLCLAVRTFFYLWHVAAYCVVGIGLYHCDFSLNCVAYCREEFEKGYGEALVLTAGIKHFRRAFCEKGQICSKRQGWRPKTTWYSPNCASALIPCPIDRRPNIHLRQSWQGQQNPLVHNSAVVVFGAPMGSFLLDKCDSLT